MKKLIVSISFILIALSTLQLSAQWQNDVRLSNNPSNSLASRDRGIAVYGNNLHVVWQDERDGVPKYTIYVQRTTVYHGALNKGFPRLVITPVHLLLPCIKIQFILFGWTSGLPR